MRTSPHAYGDGLNRDAAVLSVTVVLVGLFACGGTIPPPPHARTDPREPPSAAASCPPSNAPLRAGEEPAMVVQQRASHRVENMAFSADGRLAVVGRDGSVSIWDVASRTLQGTVRSTLAYSDIVTWSSRDSSVVVSAPSWGGGDTVSFDVGTGVLGNRKSGMVFAPVRGSKTWQYVVWSGYQFELVDETWTHRQPLAMQKPIGLPGSPSASMLSSAANHVAYTRGHQLVVWDVDKPTEAGREVPVDSFSVCLGADGKVAFAATRVAGQDAYQVSVVDLDKGTTTRTLAGSITGQGASLPLLDASPDGRFVGLARKPEIRVWNADSGAVLWARQLDGLGGDSGPNAHVVKMVFSRDGRWLVVATASGAVHVFDGASGKWLGSLGSRPRIPRQILFTKGDVDDEARLVVTSADHASVWLPRTASIVHALNIKGLHHVGASDGALVAAATRKDQAGCKGATLALRISVPPAEDTDLQPICTGPGILQDIAPSDGNLLFAADDTELSDRTYIPRLLGCFNGNGLVLYNRRLSVADLFPRSKELGVVTGYFAKRGELTVGLGATSKDDCVGDSARFGVWRTADRKLLFNFRTRGPLSSVDSLGSRVVSAGKVRAKDYDRPALSTALANLAGKVNQAWAVTVQKAPAGKVESEWVEATAITAVAFAGSSDDTVIGFEDGTVRRYRSGRLVAESASRGGAIRELAFDEGGTMATVSDDSGVRLWDAERLQERAALFEFDDDERLVLSPGGAYAGTTEASDRVAWRFSQPNEVFRFEQFASHYARPDIVAQRLLGSKADVEPITFRPPRVTLAAGSVATSGASTTLGVHVASEGRVDVVRVFREGRLVTEKLVCQKEADEAIEVPLLPGANRITVVAFDHDGFASNGQVADVTRTTSGRRPDLWLTSIGIGHYPRLDVQQQLHADVDARKMDDTLAKLAGPGKSYQDVHRTLLVDDQASPSTIRAALQGLRKMGKDDTAIVFLSGHGAKLASSGDAVFLTSGASGNLDAITKNSISWHDIAEALSLAKGRVVVLLDACHSGHVTRDLLVGDGSLANELAHSGRAGVLVFAASKGRQQSYETTAIKGIELEKAPNLGSASVHGLFTAAFLASVDSNETDRDGNGSIEMSELIDSVTARVHTMSEGRQTPWVPRREIFGDFGIAPRPTHDIDLDSLLQPP